MRRFETAAVAVWVGACALALGFSGCSRGSGSSGSRSSSATAAGVGSATTSGGGTTAGGVTPSSPTSSVAPDGLRTVALSGTYFGRTPREVTICCFDEDLRTLDNPRLQIDEGSGWFDSLIPRTYVYFALNNQGHYTGNAGFLNFEDPQAITPTRRYRILAERNGVTLTSNVVVIPFGAPTGPVRIIEPVGAYDSVSPPVLAQAPRAEWGPQSERSIVTLYRLELAPTPTGIGLMPEAVIEVAAPQHDWGSLATETWVQGRSSLPPGRYALDVMNVDANGWVTGWSTDTQRGVDAYYRFDVR